MSKSGTTILLVGSGGREHAMAWKLARSPRCARLIVVPGNDGMSAEWERWNLGISTTADFEKIAERAIAEKVCLAIIGPDNPLADGIVDVFEKRGIRCFGPTRAAAQIEASKAFSKDVMRAAGVPTAKYEVFSSASDARKFLNDVEWGSGWVIKADGLAYGKGVQVCESRDEALRAIDSILTLGSAADRLIIEERLVGEESSWFAFSDGDRCALFEPARDHKRIFDGNQGPNTGGMGAFSPVPGLPSQFAERVKREVFEPTLAEMKRRGVPFKGVLFAGLMVDAKRDCYWVLEFNCRFGDPETQVLLLRMKDDLLEWCEAVADGALARMPEKVGFVSDAACVVIGAARGYPEKPEKGASISGASLEAPAYFCAGVAKSKSNLVTFGNASSHLITSGGRVLGATGMGATLSEARAQAYDRIAAVRFEGMQFRKDIGVSS